MMLITRKEYASLVDRIEKLERDRKYGDDPVNFTVMETRDNLLWNDWTAIPKQIVPVKEAIQRIMTHLGLRMEYVKGTPAKVDFVPTVKPQEKKK